MYLLKRGEEIGFRKTEPGRITAVAGQHEISLPDGAYIWRRKGDF
jgi:hypothetical protein